MPKFCCPDIVETRYQFYMDLWIPGSEEIKIHKYKNIEQ